MARTVRPYVASGSRGARPSEFVAEIDARVARLDRVKVIVLDAAGGFTRQTRGIPIRDVVVVGIERVQQIDTEIQAPAFVPGLEIHDARSARLDAAVLDQRPRTEVAQPRGSVETTRRLE